MHLLPNYSEPSDTYTHINVLYVIHCWLLCFSHCASCGFCSTQPILHSLTILYRHGPWGKERQLLCGKPSTENTVQVQTSSKRMQKNSGDFILSVRMDLLIFTAVLISVQFGPNGSVELLFRLTNPSNQSHKYYFRKISSPNQYWISISDQPTHWKFPFTLHRWIHMCG